MNRNHHQLLATTHLLFMEMTNHGVWQLGNCTEQKCKVFYDFASKVENRKVLESQLIQVKG